MKGEISWRRETQGGMRWQVYAKRVGKQWRFYARERRYEVWQEVAQPPLEDWLALLDGVRRRIARRLTRPDEAGRILKRIREAYPGVDVS